jgi:hypothetical protein
MTYKTQWVLFISLDIKSSDYKFLKINLKNATVMTMKWYKILKIIDYTPLFSLLKLVSVQNDKQIFVNKHY